MLAAIQVLYDHWQRLEQSDRARVRRILRDSRGLPHQMSPRERSELVDIARRFDHIALGSRPREHRGAVSGAGPEEQEAQEVDGRPVRLRRTLTGPCPT